MSRKRRENTQQVTVTLPAEMVERIDALAETNCRSRSAEIEVIVRQWLAAIDETNATMN